MNEMTQLAELGAQLDPPSAYPPPDTRRQVMAAARARKPFLSSRLGLSRIGSRKLGLRLAAAGALAAVATGAVLAGQVVEVGDHPPAAAAEAADILRGAAAQAHRKPTVTVPGDQFIYVESLATSASIDEGGDRKAELVPVQREIWLSVDGTRDGLLRTRPRDGSKGWNTHPIPGCKDGKMKVSKYPGQKPEEIDCVVTPGYRGDLPTDPDAMLALLRSQGTNKNPADQRAFTAAGDLIREAYLSPAVLSAVFEAVSRIPGVTVVGSVKDEAGRTGVAVARDEVQGTRVALIFDPETFEYLGEQTLLLEDQNGLKAGQSLNSTAILRVAVVPTAGRP